MTNFEFYKDKLMAIADDGSDVAMVKGEPAACDDVMCSQCELGEFNCGVSLIHWLYAEHVEKPKINKKTKMFFDAIETGWVSRDRNGAVYIWADGYKPRKGDNVGIPCWVREATAAFRCIQIGNESIDKIFPFLTLDFIKWEDEEPWSVEDIRKLEVV